MTSRVLPANMTLVWAPQATNALSDRILVMSERPGTFIEEIVVDMPDRDNPMQRRKHPRLVELVSQLMGLLKLDAQADVH